MGKKGGAKRAGRGSGEAPRRPGSTPQKKTAQKRPEIVFEDFAAADRAFLEALSGTPIPLATEFAAKYQQAADPLSEGDAGSTDRNTRGKSRRGKQNQEIFVIDLHGLSQAAAESRLESLLRPRLAEATGMDLTVKIITGKGLHSGPGGAVLPNAVHAYIRRAFQHSIVAIEESPAEVILGGLPVRGHFHVTLRRR